MTAVPAPRTWVAGEVVTATEMNNNISAVLSFLLQPPLVQVRNAGAVQAIANNTFVALTFDTEDVDTSGMHSTSTNTSRFTAVYPGWYHAWGSLSLGTSTVGRRGGQWRLNGAAAGMSASTAYNATISTALVPEVPFRVMDFFLNAGDYVEIYAFQDSGGSLNTVISGAPDQCSAGLKWDSN